MSDEPRVSAGERSFPLRPPEALRSRFSEATYLTVENHERYRLILWYIYQRHKGQESGIRTRDIHGFMLDNLPGEYLLETCQRDLQMLVEWGNLRVEADRSRVGSIEDYHALSDIYFLTSTAARLEAAIEESMADSDVGVSLDSTRIDLLVDAIVRLDDGLMRTQEHGDPSPDFIEQNVISHWNTLSDLHERINQNAAHFYEALQKAEAEEMGDAENIQRYRTIIYDHLTGFIHHLQDKSAKIRSILLKWRKNGTDQQLVDLVTAHNLARALSSGDRDPENVRHYWTRRVNSIASWQDPGQGYERLAERTRRAIQRASTEQRRFTSALSSGNSRLRSLRDLTRDLANAEDVDGAHRLFAQAFGMALPTRLTGDVQAAISPDRSAWHAPSTEVPIRRVVGGSRPQPGPVFVQNRSLELLSIQEEQTRRTEAHASEWAALFSNGDVVLDELELPHMKLLHTLLEVIDECSPHEPGNGLRAIGPDDQGVRLFLPPDPASTGVIHTPEGAFHLPRYTLRHFPMTRQPS